MFRLRSNRGKLLLDMSTLIRCPARKTLLVGHRSIVSSYIVPGSSSSCRAVERRYLPRTIPSHRLTAYPSGCTSTSLAVKSVSGPSVLAYRVTDTGPVTSRSSVSGSDVNTSTSLRYSTGRWSYAPQDTTSELQQVHPPTVGAGLSGL